MSESNTKASPLASTQVRRLRALAHHLRPVILLGGKGLTDAVTRETDGTLEHHELIKVRSSADGKQARREELQQLADATGAQLVQLIGRMGVLYRAGDPPVIFAAGVKAAKSAAKKQHP